ncbi:MAG: amino acid permease [Bacteroidales bacterium]|jgi:amino acid transporter|nr:amino acid permease [Bacteroidales bacterium]
MTNISTDRAMKKFGTAPVFFTSISTILGAILFLRFGYAVGNMGFWGAILIILLGHTITIPTALAISEIATNTRVEGGGEYFIISRSFGLKIGSTIGITLYIAQAIGIAFYIIAFTESFSPFFDWFAGFAGFALPKQVVSVPVLFLLAYFVLKKGSGSSLKILYVITGILFVSLLCFFAGSPVASGNASATAPFANCGFFNSAHFFFWFAICFPAFTGMTAGVGLSGDLQNPGKSIPLGTMLGTVTGLVVYALVVWKLSVSASQADLLQDQLMMSRIALGGSIIIPLGLMASTFSSAMGSAMVAPRTLQALASDKSFPMRKINLFLAKGRGQNHEPFNAAFLSFVIALVFVLLGDVNAVAQIISMFFLITYGSLCLISFLNHFGSPPSYRPRFRSKWFLSLGGFLLSIWVMFKINAMYTVLAYAVIVIIYLFMENSNKEQKGLVNIFKGTLFQLNRKIQVFMQKHQTRMDAEEWRPAAICISSHSFERNKALDMMQWISHRHGFGTYFHFIEGYYNEQTFSESQELLAKLIDNQKEQHSALYIDTMISPSYTSALAQVIQAPSISGMENNMVLFEFDKQHPEELTTIINNIPLVKAGNFDVCIFGGSAAAVRYRNGIHVWITDDDETNVNLMILLGYIIMAHPDWRKSFIKIFSICATGKSETTKQDLEQRIAEGRLPITLTNIEIITLPEEKTFNEAVSEHSQQAGITILGFTNATPTAFFTAFDNIGDILLVNTDIAKNIG